MKTTEQLQNRCLIIEDNIPAAELMKIYLDKYGVLSELAADGETGLEKYSNAPSQYHIIFLDIQMPGINGYEVAKRIRESGAENAADIPIIAMSGSNTGDISKNSSFDFFLRKPFEFNSLLKVINEFLIDR